MQYVGTPALLIVAILLVVGFLYTPQGCQQGGSLSASAGAEFKDPILQVGQSHAYAAEAFTVVQNLKSTATQRAVQGGGLPELTPFDYLSSYMQAANNLAQQAAVFELARTNKIEVDEDDMRGVITQMNEDFVAQQRQQFELIQTMQVGQMEAEVAKLKKDKASATQITAAEKRLADTKAQTFDASFQQQLGNSPADYVKAQVADIEARASKDPTIARSVEATAIQQKLLDKYRTQVDTSDTALKATYDKVVFKTIMLNGANSETKAAEVLQKIKGGMDFDQAAKQFSMMKKPDGSVQVDSTIETRMDMIGNPVRDPILKLKAGEVSDVVTVAGASYIYKLVAVRPDVPKDFEKVKSSRADMVRNQSTSSMLNDAIAGLIGQNGEKVKWSEPGFQLLADYMDANLAEDKVAALEKVLADSESVSTNFNEIPPLVKYATINQLQVEVKDAAKKQDLKAKLLEAYESIVDIAPSVDLRFQYIEALIAAGQGDRALELLVDNAQAATPASEQTEPLIARVEKLLPKAANLAKKGSPLVEEVQEEIKLWREELANRKKEEEELKKQNAAEEAELKKQEAADKAKAEAPKTTPEPKPVDPAPIPPKAPGSGG